jgi:integrase
MASVEKRRLPSGAISWRASYRTPDGRQRSKSFAREREAKAFLATIEASKSTGTYVDPSRSRITVGTIAQQWRGGKVNLKPTTCAVVDSALSVHVLPRWGDVPLQRVEHVDIQAWIATLSESGMSGWYVRKVAGVLRGVLSLAVKDRRLHSNPANDLNFPPIGAKRRRYLTSLQVEQLANTAKSGRVVVLVLAYCGIRWSEMAALRVRHIDLLRRRLMIEEGVTEVNGAKIVWGTPKSHERRSVPIPKSVVAELAIHVAGKSRDDLAFAAPGGGVLRNRNARRAWFDAAATVIGVPGLTPHELRHTAASLAVSAGANVKAVQRMLGHASAAVTLDIYADLFDDDLDAVADRLDDVRDSARQLFVANVLPQRQVVDLAERRQDPAGQ